MFSNWPRSVEKEARKRGGGEGELETQKRWGGGKTGPRPAWLHVWQEDNAAAGDGRSFFSQRAVLTCG